MEEAVSEWMWNIPGMWDDSPDQKGDYSGSVYNCVDVVVRLRDLLNHHDLELCRPPCTTDTETLHLLWFGRNISLIQHSLEEFISHCTRARALLSEGWSWSDPRICIDVKKWPTTEVRYWALFKFLRAAWWCVLADCFSAVCSISLLGW